MGRLPLFTMTRAIAGSKEFNLKVADARYGCVVAKIAEFRATLKGSSESVMDQSAAKNAGISAA